MVHHFLLFFLFQIAQLLYVILVFR